MGSLPYRRSLSFRREASTVALKHNQKVRAIKTMNGSAFPNDVQSRTFQTVDAPDQTPHYVRSITEVGEQSEVVAQDDIFAANGILLLAKGTKINRSTWKRLAAHKLRAPLDLLLATADAVSEVSLARDIDIIIASDSILTTMSTRSGDSRSLKSVLGQVKLPAAAAFRLTVMRHDRRRLFDHSLRVAIIAHHIGIRMDLPAAQQEYLLLASLCHDFGEMHTDPELLATHRPIQSAERRFIYVHPITGYVVLQQMNGIPAEVMRAVLQHHERLDGSGYPSGDAGDEVCLLARIIAVAETFEAVTRRFDVRRFDITFRLSQGRLDRTVINALYELLPERLQLHGVDANEPDHELAKTRISNLFRDWPSLLSEIENCRQNESLQFLSNRITSLQTAALQAGLSPDLLKFLDLEGDDAEVLHELTLTLDELGRQLLGVAHEIDRRATADSAVNALVARVLRLVRSGYVH